MTFLTYRRLTARAALGTWVAERVEVHTWATSPALVCPGQVTYEAQGPPCVWRNTLRLNPPGSSAGTWPASGRP